MGEEVVWGERTLVDSTVRMCARSRVKGWGVSLKTPGQFRLNVRACVRVWFRVMRNCNMLLCIYL
jgi:hypothetical protein